MPLGKGGRRLLRVLGSLLGVLAVIWFACPLWFPWILRPLASKAGVRISAYERLGYSRFLLRGVALTNESFVLHIERAGGLVPSVWLWRLVAGSTGGPLPFLTVTNWDFWLLPNSRPATPVYGQVVDAASAFQTIERWVPSASFIRGTVNSGEISVGISQAAMGRKMLKALVELPAQISGQTIAAELALAHPFDLRIHSTSNGLDSTLQVITNRSGLDLRNVSLWNSNRCDLEVHFRTADTSPQTASARADHFRIPGSLVGLPAYREIDTSLSAQWESGRFFLNLSAAGQPVAQQSNLPPVEVNLHLLGDTNSATVQTLTIQSPFLTAQLSNQVAVGFSAPFLRGPATLRLAADLAQQRWLPLTGNLTGELDVASGQNRLPHAELRLSGSQIGNDSLKADSIAVSASLDWPLVELSKASFDFNDGSRAEVTGKFDLERRSASAGQFRFAGPLAQHWLPSGFSYSDLSVTGTFAGTLDRIIHSGHLVARSVTTPVLQPAGIDLQWKGENRTLDPFQLRLDETNSSISAGGSLSYEPDVIRLRLDRLDLSTNGLKAMVLAQPVTLGLKLGRGWDLQSTPFNWTGAAGEVAARASVHWPSEGAIALSLQRFPVELLNHFTKTNLPPVEVKQLAVSLSWSNGPARLSIEAAGTGLPPPGTAGQILAIPLNFEVKLSGDERGLTLSNLTLNTATSSVVTVRGFLPLALRPASTNLIDLDPQTALKLNASVRPQAYLWDELARLTGVRLDQPMLDVNLSGTWRAPEGTIDIGARRIQFTRTNALPLRLENLRLTFGLDRDKASLTNGQLLVQGQQVSLNAVVPLGESAWMGLLHRQLPPLDNATARLRIQNAALASLEPLAPGLLAPQGELNVDLQMFPGPHLEGAIIVRHARTRPLGNTSPVRDINVTLRFHDRLLTLEQATANLSGAEVNLSGRVDLRGTNWLGGDLPPFDLVLRGTNVPLSREPEYILRGDLALSVAKTNDAPPLVFGTARLRDSFYLSDLSALVPSGAATPSARPPYFSIDNPFLADWRLAVTVEGVRWLRLRTSLFNGEVSANLHLQGTLKDPVALGDLKVDSGSVRFPFANLQVQQGLVTLTSQDPYHPQLLVRATSKQFGYDIHMEVSGPIDSPIIQFTSNPSLSSEQILLMITAGQLPAGSFTLTPQQRAQTVALFLGRDLLSKLGLGDQSQQRLTISSGEEISEQGRQTYRVEYKLTDRWSVEGEYDRFGDFNADLKWRIYSK